MALRSNRAGRWTRVASEENALAQEGRKLLINAAYLLARVSSLYLLRLTRIESEYRSVPVLGATAPAPKEHSSEKPVIQLTNEKSSRNRVSRASKVPVRGLEPPISRAKRNIALKALRRIL